MTIFSDNEELQGFRISFVETSKDKADIIEQALLSLETCKSPKEFKDILRKLFAETHSIKGASRAYGMVEISIICHKFEDLLLEVLGQSKEASLAEYIETMLEYVDVLGNYFNEFLKNKSVDAELFRRQYPKIFQKLVESSEKKVSPGKMTDPVAKKINVLLVGLTKPIIKQVKQAFFGIDHKVSFAVDPLDALYRIAHEGFDLVLSSYIMSPINGVSFSVAVKAQWGDKAPKIIVFSSEEVKKITHPSIEPDQVILKTQTLPIELRNFCLNIFLDQRVEVDKNISKVKPSFKTINKIYFIDDDENILNLLEAILEDKKNVVSFTKITKSDPMNELLKQLPDLIVSDVNVPEVNTLELLKKIKNHPLLKNSSVVFLTGDVDQEICKELLSLGAAGILDKEIILTSFFDELTKLGFKI